jgi:hypothetical protein
MRYDDAKARSKGVEPVRRFAHGIVRERKQID